MAFQLKCPKCGTPSVEVYQEKVGWTQANAELVLHCHSCGKMMYGKPVEEEIQRQRQAPEPPKPATPTPVRQPTNHDGYLQMLRNEVHRMVAEGDAAVAQAETRQAEALQVRQSCGHLAPNSEPARMQNLLNIEMNRTRYLMQELHRAVDQVVGTTSMERLRRLINETHDSLRAIHKVAQSTHTQADRLIKAVEFPEVEPEPKPVVPVPAAAPASDICAFVNCHNPAAPGRAYCGDDCRKRQARWTYNQRKKQNFRAQ